MSYPAIRPTGGRYPLHEPVGVVSALGDGVDGALREFDSTDDPTVSVGRVSAIYTSGPVPRSSLRPPEDGEWPSVAFTAHARACPQGRKCTHQLEFPDWWTAMTPTGVEFDTIDAAGGVPARVRQIHRYRGTSDLRPAQMEFVKAVVLDSLVIAQQPLTKTWVRVSLANMSSLTAWSVGRGVPLTREAILDEENRYRWARWREPDLRGSSLGFYEARLELIADHILGDKPRGLPRVLSLPLDPLVPLNLTEENDLWRWRNHLRPNHRRDRMGGVLTLGLGFGLSRAEKYVITGADIFRDAHGVHVRVPATHGRQARVVTCREDWEERMWEVAKATLRNHLIVAPWRTDPGSFTSLDCAIRRAQKWAVPVEFCNNRLRNTWLAHHLAAAVPINIIATAAGLDDPRNLLRLLPHMPDPGTAVTASWLRHQHEPDAGALDG